MSDQSDYLQSLQQAWSQCQACMLCNHRKNIVFGYGNPDADLMIIGEAPGMTEDDKGEPFIGAAGNLLEYFLAWVSADKDHYELLNDWDDNKFQQSRYGYTLNQIFFTNIVCCRPPDNRNPTPLEIAACRPRLLETIYTVDPKLIIAVGGLATETLAGKKIAITAKRGQVFDSIIPGRLIDVTYPVLAVLHTSYLLRRNDFNQDGGMSDKTYNDYVYAMHVLDEYKLLHRGVPKPEGRPELVEET